MSISLQNVKSDFFVSSTAKSFSVIGNRLVEDKFTTKVIKFFDSEFEKNEILKIVDYVKKKIDNCLNNLELKQAVLNLGNRIVKCFFSNTSVRKTIILLDRILAQIREGNTFLLNENKKLFLKWVSYGFEKELFYQYPAFSVFLLESFLASQMKITKDGIRKIDNEPAILVEGKWTKFSELNKRFSYKSSTKYKEVFIYEKETNKVFTYLPNGKGLCQHHPYLDAANPVGKLTNEKYSKIIQQALKFEREYTNKKKYKHVLQVVTSKGEDNSSFFCKMNFFEFFQGRHPYIRIIDGETKQVYILGYGIWQFNSYNFLTNFIGRFRSLDPWEYKNCKEKIVTNIPLNEEEKNKLLYYCKKFINDDVFFGKKIAFNFMKQNCTSFVKGAVDYAINQKIHTDLKIDEIIYCIAPDFLRKMGFFIKNLIYSVRGKIACVLPAFINEYLRKTMIAIKKIWSSFVALSLSIIASVLGAIRGIKARKLDNPDTNSSLNPPLRNLFNWFDYSFFKFDIPGQMQLWQLQQKSSVIFNNPKFLTIISD